MDSTTKAICTFKVIPMIKTIPASQFGGLGEALLQSGLALANISVQTREGYRLLELLSGRFPDLLVGAGNVQTPGEAQRALDAGARFVFSPLFDLQIIHLCKTSGVPVYPVTTDVSLAEQQDLDVIGFYPVEKLGGLQKIDAMAELRSLRCIVAGGIVRENLLKYLSNPSVVAAIGSWMIDPVLAVTGDWGAFTENCRKARILAESQVVSE